MGLFISGLIGFVIGALTVLSIPQELKSNIKDMVSLWFMRDRDED